MHWPLTDGLTRAEEAAKKSGDGWKCVPQRLKPYLFSIVYVRAEARTLQRTEFFRSLLRSETMALQDERYTREFLLERTGRLSQAGGISHFTHADGKAKGVSTLRVRTTRGLEYWVVPDRGMDIFEASFLGRSLCWHSPVGMVHPAYYSNRGTDWLRSFPTRGSSAAYEACGEIESSISKFAVMSNNFGFMVQLPRVIHQMFYRFRLEFLGNSSVTIGGASLPLAPVCLW